MIHQGHDQDLQLKSILHGVIWDMDGVLIDSMELHYSAWTTVFSEFNIQFTQENFHRFFGRTNLETIQGLLGNRLTIEEAIDLSNRKQALFVQKAIKQAQLIPGVLQWLKFFHKLKIPQAVASSNTQEFIETIANRLKILGYLNCLVSAEGLVSKPDPAVFLKSAQHLGSNPKHCLVFEDAISGVYGAKRAGMKCIAITTSNDASLLAKADLIISDYEGLTRDQILAVMNVKQFS